MTTSATSRFDIKQPVVRPSDETFNVLRDAGYSTYFNARDSVLELSKPGYREWFDLHVPSTEWVLGELVDQLKEEAAMARMARYQSKADGSFELVKAAA